MYLSNRLAKIAKEIKAQNNMQEIHNKIKQFFTKNPNPNDDQVHDLAEQLNMESHELENHIYMILTQMLQSKTAEVNSEKELELGKKIEREHGKTIKWLIKKLGEDPESEKSKKLLEKAYESIALDHLSEIKNYYSLLKKMEQDAGIED